MTAGVAAAAWFTVVLLLSLLQCRLLLLWKLLMLPRVAKPLLLLLLMMVDAQLAAGLQYASLDDVINPPSFAAATNCISSSRQSASNDAARDELSKRSVPNPSPDLEQVLLLVLLLLPCLRLSTAEGAVKVACEGCIGERDERGPRRSWPAMCWSSKASLLVAGGAAAAGVAGLLSGAATPGRWSASGIDTKLPSEAVTS
jgi:hypothetical protein